MSTESDAPLSLQGLRIWLVRRAAGRPDTAWDEALKPLLEARGAVVKMQRPTAAIGASAWNALGDGVERVATTLRLRSLPTEPDVAAVDALRATRPDLIFVDDPQAVQPFRMLRELVGSGVMIVGLLTDFELPLAWADSPADAVIAPTMDQLAMLRDQLRAAESLEMAGPPRLHPVTTDASRAAARVAMKLDDEQLAVLVDVSTMNPSLVDRVVAQIGDLPPTVQCFCFHGGVEDSANALRSAASARRVRAKAFGSYAALPQVILGCDLAVVGTHATSLVDVVGAAIPCVGVGTHAGVHALVREGVMVPLASPDSLAALLRQVAEMGVASSHIQAASAMAERVDNTAIVDALARLASRREDLLRKPRSGGPSDMVDGELRFETIGASASMAPVTPGAFDTIPLSRSAARDALSALLIEERRLDRLVSDAVVQRDTWMLRKLDAEEEGAADLLGYATSMLDSVVAQLRGYQEQLAAIASEKERLRERVHAQGSVRAASPVGALTPDEYERRYQEMEARRQLRELRAKAAGKDKG